MLGSDAILWADSDVFLETFGAIRSGRFLEHDPHRTLLYPYFLTAFLIWSGEPPMDQIIVAAQHLLGVDDRRLFLYRPAGVRSAHDGVCRRLVLTVHTTQLFYELSILSEVLFTCVLAIARADGVLCSETDGARRHRHGLRMRGADVDSAGCASVFFVVPLGVGHVVSVAWRGA